MIVFDTDILSMFAKIDAIDLLKQLFGKTAVITPKIRDEHFSAFKYYFFGQDLQDIQDLNYRNFSC
jgi:predicted nucleic acid-binding protein